LPKGRHYKITLADTLDAHDRALRIGGGAIGISNSSLIESAIGRPYTGYYRPIYKKAAALAHSLCRNHGFVDGNKRTALFAVELLLGESGYRLAAISSRELEEFYISVADGSLNFDEITNWFRKQIKA